MAFPEVDVVLDGVYFDDVNGVPGTDFPGAGTPEHPSNNLADVLTMMAARNVRKLYLAGATDVAHTLTFDVACNIELVGNASYDIVVNDGVAVQFTGDVVCSSLTNGTGGIVINGKLTTINDVNNTSGNIGVNGEAEILGDLYNDTGNFGTTSHATITGGITNGIAGGVGITGNLKMVGPLITDGQINVFGSLTISAGDFENHDGAVTLICGDCSLNNGNIINNGTGNISIEGNVFVAGNGVGAIANVGSGTILIEGNVQVSAHVENSGGGNITILGKLDVNGNPADEEGYLDNTDGNIVFVGNDCHIAGGNASDQAIINSTGAITICGDCQTSRDIISEIGRMEFWGNIDISGDIDEPFGNLTTEGVIFVGGHCFISSQLSNSGVFPIYIAGDFTGLALTVDINGSVEINGNCHLRDDLNVSDAAGWLGVYGDIRCVDINNAGNILLLGLARIYGTITNTGTLTYHGVYPETAVNITAILASETDVLNLAAIDGYHYTIDDLVLKCADPGVNTINVKLYKLVNGVSTLVDTFGITTASFATYFNMMDLFGQPLLAGDNLKITVQATGGGPYAVTGSYAYRSA